MNVFLCSLLFTFNVRFCGFSVDMCISQFTARGAPSPPWACARVWGSELSQWQRATGGFECAGTRNANILWCAWQPCTPEQCLPKCLGPRCGNPASGSWCFPLCGVFLQEEPLDGHLFLSGPYSGAGVFSIPAPSPCVYEDPHRGLREGGSLHPSPPLSWPSSSLDC